MEYHLTLLETIMEDTTFVAFSVVDRKYLEDSQVVDHQFDVKNRVGWRMDICDGA